MATAGDPMRSASAVISLALLVFIPARAAEPPSLTKVDPTKVDPIKAGPQGFTSDFANVIKDSEREQIDHDCNNYLAATRVAIGVVTVPGLKGRPIASFARELYDGWGFGKNNNTEGVLIILSIADKQSRIEVGRGLAQLVPSKLADETLRAGQMLLKGGKYGEAALQMARAIGDAVSKTEGVSIDKPMSASAPDPTAATQATPQAPQGSERKEYYMPFMGMMPLEVMIFMIVFLALAFVYLPIQLIIIAWRAFRTPRASAGLGDRSLGDASDDSISDSVGTGLYDSGSDTASSGVGTIRVAAMPL